MKRHSIDISAFVFGIVFLLAAAFAMAVQAGTFAFGDSRGDTWVAPAVLLTTGAVAVVGTLIAAATNRSGSTEPQPAPVPATTSAIVVSDATTEMPTMAGAGYGAADRTAEHPVTRPDTVEGRDVEGRDVEGRDDADDTRSDPLG